MVSTRHTLIAAVVGTFGLAAHAQAPVDHAAHHPAASASAPVAAGASMSHVDEHIQRMRDMHDRMTRAQTPGERSALMAEHMKLMQEGMALMHGMKPGGPPMGKGGAMHGKGPIGGDMSQRHETMEKRMEMMQSMMQMMLDRMSAAPTPP